MSNNVKAHYVRGLLVLADLKKFDASLRNGAEKTEYIRLLRQMLVALDNYSEFMTANLSKLISSDDRLTTLKRNIKKLIKKIHWLRSNVVAHISPKIIENVVCSKPLIFNGHKTRKERMKVAQLMFIESAVNFIFEQEDLNFSSDVDADQFVKWMQNVAEMAIEITERTIDLLE